MNVDIM